jgi:predicted nucleotidyltransferase
MVELTAAQLACVHRILAARLPGREVRIFGSRVTGRAKPYSDLDLVIMGEERIPDLPRADLAYAFDESDLPFRVDVILWADAPPSLREVILRSSEPITQAA